VNEIPGFLSSRAVLELVHGDISDTDFNPTSILNRVENLLSVLPVSWKIMVNNKANPVHTNRNPHIFLVINTQKMLTSWRVVHDIFIGYL